MKYLFSIGHSNVKDSQLIKALLEHKVETLVDVRSRPYSRFCPQFNQKAISAMLKSAGIAYYFLGDQLGGMRGEGECDPKGYPIPEIVFRYNEWNDGIVELLEHAGCGKTAVMCSERDYKKCHRHFLIEKYLMRGEWRMKHIDVKTGILWDNPPMLNLGL